MHAPATTNRIKAPAPRRAPMAKAEVSAVAEVKAAVAPKMSGAPLPRATKVTPAMTGF